MALLDHEFALLQRSIDAIMDKVARLGLSLSIEHDFKDLAKFLREHEAYANETFDPAIWRLNGTECFWFRLTDPQGRVVASHADRIYRTEDFCALVETGELWFANPDKEFGGRKVKVLRPPVRLSGVVGYSGSLYVDKAYRGHGLAVYLPYLSRSVCLRNFATDFHTGMVFKHLAGTKVPRQYYGYPHIDLCVDGFVPPNGHDYTTSEEEATARLNRMLSYLCWISQAEAIERLRQLPAHELYPVALDAPTDGAGSAARLDREVRELDRKVREDAVARADYQHVDLAPVFRQRQ